MELFTARNRSLGQVIFSQVCVNPSVHKEGVCIQWGGPHPGGLPRGRGVRLTPPKTHRILQDTVNERAVRILLECILVKHKTPVQNLVTGFNALIPKTFLNYLEPFRTFFCVQSSHFSGLTKFPDFSSIFCHFSSIFFMFYFFN